MVLMRLSCVNLSALTSKGLSESFERLQDVTESYSRS